MRSWERARWSRAMCRRMRSWSVPRRGAWARCAPAACGWRRSSARRAASAIGRPVKAAWLLFSAMLGCASTGPAHDAVEYEIAYDDNRPAEATAAASPTWEVMVRFKPTGSSWRALRLRALLAQEGQARWTIYAQDQLEQPGEVIASWDRDYGKDAASGLTDGRWVVEDLGARLGGSRRGAVWIGFRGTARLWSCGIDSENAFVRDPDPARFLRPMPIRKTPMMRLDWAP